MDSSSFALPKLPELDDDLKLQKHFYSEEANWIIPGMILAGKSPAKSKNVDAYVKDLFVNAKVTTYVCLQSEVVPQSEEAEDLGGEQIGNEVDQLPSYAEAVSNVNPVSKFVYYGMKDDEIAPSEDSLRALVENISQKVKKGETIYVHCKGGSGRTGIVAACLLGTFYPDLSADEVLERVQQYFELRARGVGKWVNPKLKSPATDEQRDQVREFLGYNADNTSGEDTEAQNCNISCAIM